MLALIPLAMSVMPPMAHAESEGDAAAEDGEGEAEADVAADTDATTAADGTNAKHLTIALPSHVWLIKEDSLWRAATKGGGARRVGKLPASASAADFAADPTGQILAVEIGDAWWYGNVPMDGAPLQWALLPCKSAPTLHAASAFCLIDEAQGTWGVIQLPNPNQQAKPPALIATIKLPATAQARQLGDGDVVWRGKDAIYRAPLAKIAKPSVVAMEPPVAAMSINDDGSFAFGQFEGTVRKAGVKIKQPLLYSMRLDGIGSKRRSIHTGTPLAWSRDGQWALVQDGADACIVAVAGGHFRCFEGYQGLDLAPSGEWALMRDAAGAKVWRGQRSGTKAPPPILVSAEAAAFALWDHR